MSDPNTSKDAISRKVIPDVIAKITGRRPSPSTTYRLLATGKIRAFRLSERGPLYARRADVEAFARGRVNTGPSPRETKAIAAHQRIRALGRRAKDV